MLYDIHIYYDKMLSGRETIFANNDSLNYWRTDASLDLGELILNINIFFGW